MNYDYKTFWRTVTADGRAPCALAARRCHRCEGVGRVQLITGFRPEETKIETCSACRGLGSVPCSGALDAHHYFPKRRIDLKLGGKHSPRSIAAKMDVRNGVCLCRTHHDLVEGRQVESPVPPFLSFFCAEHGLELPAAAKSGVPDEVSSLAPKSGVPDEMISLGAEEEQLRIEPTSKDVAVDPD